MIMIAGAGGSDSVVFPPATSSLVVVCPNREQAFRI
jgi:hypothetical protein